jgi:hypothetical protein
MRSGHGRGSGVATSGAYADAPAPLDSQVGAQVVGAPHVYPDERWSDYAQEEVRGSNGDSRICAIFSRLLTG